MKFNRKYSKAMFTHITKSHPQLTFLNILAVEYSVCFNQIVGEGHFHSKYVTCLSVATSAKLSNAKVNFTSFLPKLG